MFTSEQEMSIQFEKFLKTNFGNSYIKECQGLSGIPDFIFYTKIKKEVSVISFELKLKNWKRATQQAFRYRSFSNIAYVVLSNDSIHSAIKNIETFEKYNIGLASFNMANIFKVIYQPEFSIPYSENLNQKLIESIGINNKKTKNIRILIKERSNEMIKCPQDIW